MMELKIKENSTIDGIKINDINDILHILAISDTQHDFGAKYIPSTLLTLPNKEELNTIHLSEDKFMEKVFGLVIGKEDNKYYIDKSNSIIQNFDEIYNHEFIDEDPNYRTKKTNNNTDCTNINNDPLLEYFKRNIPINNNVFIVIDAIGSGFNNFLECLKNINNNDLNYNFYYIQNKQTLYDPLAKITPSTSVGKDIFSNNNNVKYSYEYIDDNNTNKTVKYPKYTSSDTDNLSKNKLFYSKFNTYQILQPLLSKNKSKKTDYSYQSYAVLNDDNNNNTVVDANMASKNGTQKKNMEYVSLAKNIINELNTLFKITNNEDSIKPTTYHSMHKMIAKRLGDQGQALSTIIEPMNLKLTDNSLITSNNLTLFGSYDRLAVASALLFEAPIVVYNYSDAKGRGYHIFTKKNLIPIYQNYYYSMINLNLKLTQLYKILNIELPTDSNLFNSFNTKLINDTLINNITTLSTTFENKVREFTNTFFLNNFNNFKLNFKNLLQHLNNVQITNSSKFNSDYKQSISDLFSNLKFIKFLLYSSKSRLLKVMNEPLTLNLFDNTKDITLLNQIQLNFLNILNQSLSEPKTDIQAYNFNDFFNENKDLFNLSDVTDLSVQKNIQDINNQLYYDDLSITNITKNLEDLISNYNKLKEEVDILNLPNNELEQKYFKIDKGDLNQFKFIGNLHSNREQNKRIQFNVSSLEKSTMSSFLYAIVNDYTLLNETSKSININIDGNNNLSFIKTINDNFNKFISKLTLNVSINNDKILKLKSIFIDNDNITIEPNVNEQSDTNIDTKKPKIGGFNKLTLIEEEKIQKILAMLMSTYLNYPSYGFDNSRIIIKPRKKIGGSGATMVDTLQNKRPFQDIEKQDEIFNINYYKPKQNVQNNLIDNEIKDFINIFTTEIQKTLMENKENLIDPSDLSISPYYIDSIELLYKMHPELKLFNESIEKLNNLITRFFEYFSIDKNNNNLKINLNNYRLSLSNFLKENNKLNTKHLYNFMNEYNEWDNVIDNINYIYEKNQVNINKFLNENKHFDTSSAMEQDEQYDTSSPMEQDKQYGGKNNKKTTKKYKKKINKNNKKTSKKNINNKKYKKNKNIKLKKTKKYNKNRLLHKKTIKK